jgi:hypothetical protein
MSKVFEILQSQSDKLDSVELSLSKIAVAANENKKVLESIDKNLEHLCGVLANAATKERIPTKVFVCAILSITLLSLVDRLTNSGTSLHADTRGLHIEQQPKAQ